MKIFLPEKDEFARWVAGMSVIFAGAAATKGDLIDHWRAAIGAWLLLLCCILIYLFIRSNVRAIFASRQRRKIARQ